MPSFRADPEREPLPPRAPRPGGRRRFDRLLVSICIVAWGIVGWRAIARAETRRFAVLVGQNLGSPPRKPLRFAEQDAEKLARALVELGNFAEDDVLLLRGGTDLRSVRRAMDLARTKVAGARRSLEGRAMLLFYFSGHSDGTALELGPERLSFGEVRSWLAGTGAEVRLAIVDSCRSGGLLASKGGAPGPAFDLALDDRLASTGEAFITSSAADEAALESAEIGGSFFSHHLLSGLRGAADSSGDGDVSLAEAYAYAFSQTLRATAATTVGPQHPAYDYRLSGRGDLVLTTLRRSSAIVELPAELDRILLIAQDTQQVVAEVGPRSARRVGIPAGYYEVRAYQGGTARAGSLRVPPGATVQLRADRLGWAAAGESTAKGEEGGVSEPAPPPSWLVSAGVGAVRSVAASITAVPVVRVGAGIGAGGKRVVAGSLEGGAVNGDRFQETVVAMRMGPSWRWGGGRSVVSAGVEIGGGTVVQAIEGSGTRWTGMGLAGLTLGAEWWMSSRWALSASVEPAARLLKRDGSLSVDFAPSAILEVKLSR